MKKTIQAEKSNEITISLSLFCNIIHSNIFKKYNPGSSLSTTSNMDYQLLCQKSCKILCNENKKTFISREIVSFSMFCLVDNINTSVCFHYQDFLFKF